MSDHIAALVTEILDGDTIALEVVERDAANTGRYADHELLRVIDGPEDLGHAEPREESSAAVRRVRAGALVRWRVRARGSDGTLIGEVERSSEPPPDAARSDPADRG